jgi:hypothetical protein
VSFRAKADAYPLLAAGYGAAVGVFPSRRAKGLLVLGDISHGAVLQAAIAGNSANGSLLQYPFVALRAPQQGASPGWWFVPINGTADSSAGISVSFSVATGYAVSEVDDGAFLSLLVEGTPSSTGQTFADWTNPFTSAFTTPLSAWFPGGVSVAPGSAVIVATLAAQAAASPYPGLRVQTAYPICVVPASQPLVTLKTGAGGTVGNITSQTCPIPPHATQLINQDSDSNMVIYQPSTQTVWELWELNYSAGNWTASGGGVMTNMRQSAGAFPYPYGLSASGLSYLGTLVTEADVLSGSIDHAVALQVCYNQIPPWPPANRTDGSPGVANSPAYGQWFTWAPGYSMPAGLSSFAQMVWTAIKNYGCIAMDHTTDNGAYIACESPADWAAEGGEGTDPITTAFGGGASYNVLTSLDLTKLEQIVPPSLGATPGTTPGAPTALSLVPGSTQVAASWTAPSTGAPINSYYLLYRTSAGPGAWALWYPNPTGTSATVTGLTTGTSYDFQVFALNGANISAGSSIVSATPALPALVAQIGTSTTAPSGNTATFSLTSAAPANSKLVICVNWKAGGGTARTLTGVSDNSGLGYTYDTPANGTSESTTGCAISGVMATAGLGTSKVITLTFSGTLGSSSEVSVTVDQWANFVSGAVDRSGAGGTASGQGTSAQLGSATTNAGDVLYSCIGSGANGLGTVTQPAGYTQTTPGGYPNQWQAYDLPGSESQFTASWSWQNTEPVSCAIVAYLP